MAVLAKTIDIRLMLPYYNHIMDLPVAFVNTRSTGEYISRFSDASAIREAVSGATLTLLLDSVMVLVCGAVLFMENPKLFCIALAVILLYAAMVICYRNPIKRANQTVMENNARVQSYLKESIDGIETIKSNQAEAASKEKNASKFRRLIDAVFKESMIYSSQDGFCEFVENLGNIIILWIGFAMVRAQAVTVGSLITFYALLAYFTVPIKNLIGVQPMMQTAIVAAERLNDILDTAAENEDERTQSDLQWGDIRFDNVDFRYGNHELILKHINLQIKRGDRVAIVGESGSGKTTLVKLLMKFYEPENGTITIGENDMQLISVREVRKGISYVDQSTFLFSDTIKNNLRIGNPQVTDEEIIAVCKATRADDFIRALPFGYDTFLDENGKNLSGGQRQRLAIARAMLRNPKLLIFDEATSNLDTITENAIRDTIFDLDKNMTCIVIAHRLSTIKNCDKIFVMENGEIIEEGTHKELTAAKGRYYQLCNQS